MLEHVDELDEFVAECREAGYTDAVLLGMGGSSLGPEVLRRSFGEIPGGLRLQVLDSTHPDAIAAVQASIDIAKTLFIVSSKSGGTVETLSQYHHFRAVRRTRAVRRRHRSRAARCEHAGRSTTACGARSATRPTSAAATRCCRTSGWCRRR